MRSHPGYDVRDFPSPLGHDEEFGSADHPASPTKARVCHSVPRRTAVHTHPSLPLSVDRGTKEAQIRDDVAHLQRGARRVAHVQPAEWFQTIRHVLVEVVVHVVDRGLRQWNSESSAALGRSSSNCSWGTVVESSGSRGPVRSRPDWRCWEVSAVPNAGVASMKDARRRPGHVSATPRSSPEPAPLATDAPHERCTRINELRLTGTAKANFVASRRKSSTSRLTHPGALLSGAGTHHCERQAHRREWQGQHPPLQPTPNEDRGKEGFVGIYRSRKVRRRVLAIQSIANMQLPSISSAKGNLGGLQGAGKPSPERRCV